ncbi:MAG: DNA-formamidopyrimidine glycosylase [Candidatus Poseidoniales archaeon]
MPELPEVDSYRTGLPKIVGGWKIRSGRVLWANASESDFKNVENQMIKGFDRRGKYLIINLEKTNIIIHLRMTGKIDIAKNTPKYTTVEFTFENKKKMCLVDYRKFGKVWVTDKIQEVVGHLGIEPLSSLFTQKKFASLLDKRSGAMKPLLLNQQFIAGIGNYLADEILFRAGIHPLRKANTLTHEEIKELFLSIRHIIRKSISYGGTTFMTFQGPEGKKGQFWKKLQVFRKTGKPCPHCKRPITRIIVGQRSTHICENKQKIPNIID